MILKRKLERRTAVRAEPRRSTGGCSTFAHGARFKIPFALSDISPAHGARRYHETSAVLSCSIDFSCRLSP